jgi:tartrate dehydratase beta subunit/fumarate hydratase class I family protein
MTANELADKCNRLQGEIILGFLADCATMLRQQSKEIESLRLRELTDEEIDEVWVETCSDFKLIENGKSKGIINIYDVSRAILKKASEK